VFKYIAVLQHRVGTHILRCPLVVCMCCHLGLGVHIVYHTMIRPPSQLAAVQALRSRLPYISQSALSSLLTIARNTPLPDACVSRRSIRRARDAVADIQTPYGPLHCNMTVDTSTGGPATVEVQSPFAMLYHSIASSPGLADFIESVHTETPSSATCPWTLVLYTDEILPGNQLSYKGARKMWGWYWSILELGPVALSDEDPLNTCGPTHRGWALLKHGTIRPTCCSTCGDYDSAYVC